VAWRQPGSMVGELVSTAPATTGLRALSADVVRARGAVYPSMQRSLRCLRALVGCHLAARSFRSPGQGLAPAGSVRVESEGQFSPHRLYGKLAIRPGTPAILYSGGRRCWTLATHGGRPWRASLRPWPTPLPRPTWCCGPSPARAYGGARDATGAGPRPAAGAHRLRAPGRRVAGGVECGSFWGRRAAPRGGRSGRSFAPPGGLRPGPWKSQPFGGL